MVSPGDADARVEDQKTLIAKVLEEAKCNVPSPAALILYVPGVIINFSQLFLSGSRVPQSSLMARYNNFSTSSKGQVRQYRVGQDASRPFEKVWSRR